MSTIIRDGKGTSVAAQVDSTHRLKTRAVSESKQNTVSTEDGQAYQVIGTATLAAATVASLHVKNTSTNKYLVVTYMRHQVVDPSGGTAIPNTSNYFRIALGRTRTGGGSAVTPVNLNSTSGNDAEVEAYANGPTLTGTAGEIDRWYTKSEADMNTFSKEGSIVLGPQGTIELSYIGDQTGGTLYSRLSFFMELITAHD